jgi:hypothetical protein
MLFVWAQGVGAKYTHTRALKTKKQLLEREAVSQEILWVISGGGISRGK